MEHRKMQTKERKARRRTAAFSTKRLSEVSERIRGLAAEIDGLNRRVEKLNGKSVHVDGASKIDRGCEVIRLFIENIKHGIGKAEISN